MNRPGARLRRSSVWWVALLALVSAAGCNQDSAAIRHLSEQVDSLKADVDHCTQELADRDALIAALRKRIKRNPTLEQINLKDLFVVDRIELVSLTGGADYDNQPGDDGITVYVRPLDKDGDVLKAAGEFTIQFYDLTTVGHPREIGIYVFDDRATLEKCWYGGLLTNHYTFKCPFGPAALKSRAREIHLRVTFLDWLTGRMFNTSKTVEISRVDPENTLVPRPAKS
jgi:hypothetical protein